LKTFELVCKRKGCGERIKMKAAVIPMNGWHEHDDLGRKEQHPMRVEVDGKGVTE
jgi:hypothetical protein